MRARPLGIGLQRGSLLGMSPLSARLSVFGQGFWPKAFAKSYHRRSLSVVKYQEDDALARPMRWGHGDRLNRAARTALRRRASLSSTAHTPGA